MIADTLFTRTPDLPPELCGDRWLAWKPNGRHKVPIGRDGRPCDPANSRHWLPFGEARQVSRIFGDTGARVGYALSGSRLVALDLDRVIDAATGAIDPDASALLDQFDTYIELSQSAVGLHAILSGDLRIGNRRTPGLEILTDGFLAVSGHPVKRGPIKQGGEPLRRIVDALPPSPVEARRAYTATLPTPVPGMVADLIARAMPNARFRKLLRGDWSEYPTQSEGDAAFCMHLARNGGDLVGIVAALRQSGLRRSKLKRNDYVCRQALFAISTADVRVPHWRGVDQPSDDETVAHARTRLQESSFARDAAFLASIAEFIAARVAAGKTPDADGFWRVSPAMLAGDFPGSPHRLMSRRGALKALHRLADAGVFSLTSGRGRVRINGALRTGRVTLLRVSGSDLRGIVDGFLRRSDSPVPPTVYVVGTEDHNL